MLSPSPELKLHLKRLVVEVCDIRNVDPAQIGDDDQLFYGEGVVSLTSLDAIEVAVALEEEYKLRIENVSTATKHLLSINAIADFITTQKNEMTQ